MTRPTPGQDSDQGATSVPGRGSRPATPRWVKVFGIVALIVVVLVVVMLVVGGGNHGPGRHTGGDAEAGAASGHTAPEGAHP